MEVSRKRFGLSPGERIKSKKDFDQLYTSGRITYSSDKKIKAIYLLINAVNNPGIKVAPVVSKKAGNAVWRNRVKRLIREAFRLNKEVIIGAGFIKDKLLLIAFSPYSLNQVKNKNLILKDIEPGVVEILHKLKSILR